VCEVVFDSFEDEWISDCSSADHDAIAQAKDVCCGFSASDITVADDGNP